MIPLATAEKAFAGDRVGHWLTDREADTIDKVLHAVLRVHVRPTVDITGTVQLWPSRPLDLAEELTVERALLAVTDARLSWNRDLVWTRAVTP